MRNVEHALDVLKELIGLPSLSMTEDVVELQFDGDVVVAIARISDTEIELSTVLEDLAENLTRERMAALLTANYNGYSTGWGRIALDPRDGKAVYCGRLDVSKLDARELEEQILTFLKYTLYWDGPGTDEILAIRESNEGSDAIAAVSSQEDLTVLRL